MDIKLSILEKHRKGEYIKPIEYEYHGNYALEMMIFGIARIYFGNKIASKIEIIINNRSEP